MTEVRYSGDLPSPGEQAIRGRRFGVWYMAEYQLRVMRAYAWSMLGYSVGQPLLYMVAMGVGLGALVDRNAGVDQVPYLVFVAPAVMLATVTLSVAGEMTYPVMAGFKWQRLYHAPHATPLTPAQIGLGHFVAVMARFLIQAAVFWLIMVIFGATTSGWSWLTVPIATLTAAAFGAPLQAYSSTLADEGSSFAMIQRFVVMPMTLFAGTYFPLESMPGYLQWIGWISPLWHGTQLARQASYGLVEPGWLTGVHLLVLVVFTGVGLTAMVRSYTRRLGR